MKVNTQATQPTPAASGTETADLSVVAPPTAVEEQNVVPTGERIRDWLQFSGSFIPLVILVIIAIIIVPNFTSDTNLQNLLTQNVTTGIVAAGMTLVIIGGAFDLSVGSIFALSTVTYATMANKGNLVTAAVVTIAACLACGLFNGIVVTRFRINSFVATLGSGLIIGGLAYIVTNNNPVYVEKGSFGTLGSTQEFLGLRYSAWILLVTTIIMAVVLSRTVFGLHVSAMGANSRAAQLIGVRISLVQSVTFVIVAGCAAIAGMISSSQLSSATANVGSSLPLDAIAAVVIGGTSLTGGKGSVARTFIGVLILGVLTNIFDSFGWNSSVQLVVKGSVILAAVGFDALRRSET